MFLYSEGTNSKQRATCKPIWFLLRRCVCVCVPLQREFFQLLAGENFRSSPFVGIISFFLPCIFSAAMIDVGEELLLYYTVSNRKEFLFFAAQKTCHVELLYCCCTHEFNDITLSQSQPYYLGERGCTFLFVCLFTTVNNIHRHRSGSSSSSSSSSRNSR